MAKTALTCEEFLEFDELERRRFADFAVLIRNYSGSSSPAEEFIFSLIRCHADGMALTPDNLTDDIEEFRQNFDLSISAARLLARQYPTEVLGENCGDWQAQIANLKAETFNETQQEAFRLEDARIAIRKYPALVMAEEMPEPWKSEIDRWESEQRSKKEA